jgi:hypothetical protein
VDVVIPPTGDTLAMWSSDFRDLYWGTPSLAWLTLCILDVISFYKKHHDVNSRRFSSAFAHLRSRYRSWVLDSARAFPFTFKPANPLPTLIFSPLSFVLNLLSTFLF